MDAFRYQHQRKLLWLSALGQRRTIDRLLGFLTLLIEEYGEPAMSDTDPDVIRGYCLPFPSPMPKLVARLVRPVSPSPA